MRLSTPSSSDVLSVGDRAPEFALPDISGTLIRLSELTARGPVVVFFYPAAMTLGCTREVCHFRDAGPRFAALGATRVGISADPQSLQSEFSRRNRLDFPLLTDLAGAAAAAYGARRASAGDGFKRATFVVSSTGTVLEVVSSRLRIKDHSDRSLEVLEAHAARNG